MPANQTNISDQTKLYDKIVKENLQFSCHLIALQRYDYKIFLESSSPEQKLMAIFGNFGEEAATIRNSYGNNHKI